ncbi:MAG: polysaccharide deacetylase family protein [Bacilli bacterium]|jgi:hypothetical protein|nr:polysaccharide deacetylase family protein [Bacilli bacterium]
MLKKVLQTIGLLLLCSFSFFYTDRVVTVVKNQDPIMIKINEYKDFYNIESVDAIINDKDIIPGINGCKVNIDKSYSNMKRIGSYNPNMIEYQEIKPELSLSKTYDKYIVKGNSNKNTVTLVFKVNNINNINEIKSILKEKKIKAAFFIDGKDIETNVNSIYPLINEGHEIYNLGYDHRYEKEMLRWTNNMIDSIANNKSNYCLVLTENQNTLDICSKEKMYTIKPDIIINYGNPFSIVRKTIEKGSIIVFDVNSITKNELIGVITFLNKKGYTFNILSNHLSEKGCQ